MKNELRVNQFFASKDLFLTGLVFGYDVGLFGVPTALTLNLQSSTMNQQ